MFFESWYGIFRVVVIGILAYTSLVIILRISGKRTLSKMSAFDLIITVALGSTLATVIISKNVVFLEGLTAFCLLTFMQMTVTWLSVRSEWFRKVTHADPTLLLHNGQFLWNIMKESRITESEIRQAIRGQGLNDPEKVKAVILETNGNLTVIPS